MYPPHLTFSQNLYLKLKMQRAMEVAGMAVPDEIRNQPTSNLTTEDLKRMRAQVRGTAAWNRLARV